MYRNLQKGSRVKAICQFGLQKQPILQFATFESLNGNEATISLNGVTQTIPAINVYEFRPLAEGQLNQFATDNFEVMTKLVNLGIETLLLGEQANKVSINAVDHIMGLCNDYITIQPEVIERTGMGVVQEMPGWSIYVWQMIPATRFEPPHTSEAIIGLVTTNIAAAALAVKTVFDVASTAFWEQIQEREFFKEMEANEPKD